MFEAGKLNVSYNCLDRHVKAGRRDKQLFSGLVTVRRTKEGFLTMSFWIMSANLQMFSKIWVLLKVTAVCIYMPMIPELAIAMLACTRIGAIHSIVFGGFSAEALRDMNS